jgi:hypothetical protein
MSKLLTREECKSLRNGWYQLHLILIGEHQTLMQGVLREVKQSRLSGRLKISAWSCHQRDNNGPWSDTSSANTLLAASLLTDDKFERVNENGQIVLKSRTGKTGKLHFEIRLCEASPTPPWKPATN